MKKEFYIDTDTTQSIHQQYLRFRNYPEQIGKQVATFNMYTCYRHPGLAESIVKFANQALAERTKRSNLHVLDSEEHSYQVVRHHFDVHETELGYWREIKEVPLSDWQYEVANNDTRVGYWAFVVAALGLND